LWLRATTLVVFSQPPRFRIGARQIGAPGINSTAANPD